MIASNSTVFHTDNVKVKRRESRNDLTEVRSRIANGGNARFCARDLPSSRKFFEGDATEEGEDKHACVRADGWISDGESVKGA